MLYPENHYNGTNITKPDAHVSFQCVQVQNVCKIQNKIQTSIS